jgi:hypothetical protein
MSKKLAIDDKDKVYAAAFTKMLQENPMLLWAFKHHYVKQGKNLDFKDKSYLLDFYCRKPKPHDVVVVQKCVQIGISEFLMLLSLYLSGDLGLWILYCFPTSRLAEKFVKLRLDAAIASSKHYKYLQELAPVAADAVSGKRFGKGALSFIGSNSELGMVEYPADVIVIDELDRANLDNLSMITNRYSASVYKILYQVSNPTLVDFGINKWFNKSTQKTWHQKCDSCGHWQCLDWFANVVDRIDKYNYKLKDTEWKPGCDRDIHVFCVKCRKPVDRLKNGTWVSAAKADIDGYKLSQLYVPTTTIKELAYNPSEGFFVSLHNTSKLQVFHRDKLGEAFSPEGSSLDASILQRAERDYGLQGWSTRPTCMGVDVGRVLHVTISDTPPRLKGGKYRRIIAAFTCNNFNELSIVLKSFNVVACVVDADPETRSAREFQARHPGIVFLNRFQKEAKIEEISIDDSLNIIKSDRTQLLDMMVADFFAGIRILPFDSSSIDGGKFWSQLLAPKRIYDEEKNRFVWFEESKDDHYFLSMAYNTMAHEIYHRGVNSTLALSEYVHYGIDGTQDEEKARRLEEYNWLFPEAAEKRRLEKEKKDKEHEENSAIKDPYHKEDEEE